MEPLSEVKNKYITLQTLQPSQSYHIGFLGQKIDPPHEPWYNGHMVLTRWQLIHEYIKRSKAGTVPELGCTLCGGQVVPLDKDDVPVLWCPLDDTEERVGLSLLDYMKEQTGAAYI